MAESSESSMGWKEKLYRQRFWVLAIGLVLLILVVLGISLKACAGLEPTGEIAGSQTSPVGEGNGLAGSDADTGDAGGNGSGTAGGDSAGGDAAGSLGAAEGDGTGSEQGAGGDGQAAGGTSGAGSSGGTAGDDSANGSGTAGSQAQLDLGDGSGGSSSVSGANNGTVSSSGGSNSAGSSGNGSSSGGSGGGGADGSGGSSGSSSGGSSTPVDPNAGKTWHEPWDEQVWVDTSHMESVLVYQTGHYGARCNTCGAELGPGTAAPQHLIDTGHASYSTDVWFVDVPTHYEDRWVEEGHWQTIHHDGYWE